MQVFLSQSPASSKVRPWKLFAVPGVAISAYEFMNSKVKMQQCVKVGIHELLDFDGPVMLDSGGYQSVQGKSINYTPQELLQFAKSCEADLIMALDFPPRKSVSSYAKLASLNHSCFQVMTKISPDVIPVVHAPLKLVKIELNLLSDYDTSYIGVGGLVVSSRGALRETVNTIHYVYERKGNAKLHVLGFGAPNIRNLIPKDIHSTDFAGWRTAAGVGYLLLPTGYRKITQRNVSGHAPEPNEDDNKIIENVCRHLDFSIHDLKSKFEARALFNAYVSCKMLF